MFEAMGDAGARLASADSETLWAMIEEMAQGHESMLASHVIAIGKHEHWTMMHTALALAYAHMVLSNRHEQALRELLVRE